MANSSDINGHGLGMRNGHSKAARTVEKPAASGSAKKRTAADARSNASAHAQTNLPVGAASGAQAKSPSRPRGREGGQVRVYSKALVEANEEEMLKAG